jgi:hypothetical protein
MRFCCVAACLLVLAFSAPAAAAEPAALAKARALYNAGSYDAAIDSAAAARREPQFADAAALVLARAHLERFRKASDPVDLSVARETLATIRSSALSPRDQIDLIIGMGQTLYLGELFGAAAELFDTALSRASILEPHDRFLLVDWWASALQRVAQSRPPDRRAPIFARIRERMEEQLRVDLGSAAANFWLAVAARGEGDLERAWDAAIAAWVRSTLTPETSTRLRSDLDRLVGQALIPERARTRSGQQQTDTIAELRAEWEVVKQQWP